MEKDRYLLSSVGKALELLDLLSHHKSLPLAELSRLSGIDKTAAFRSMYTLEKYGYVEKLPDTSYRLGIKFLYYGNLVSIRQDVVAVARPLLQQLAMSCKLAAHLGSLNGSRIVTIHKEESPYDLQVTARVGSNAPAYATAMGRAILAWLPEEQLLPLLEKFAYKRYSPRSVTNIVECRQLLAQTRRQGYATDLDDRFPGFGSVACPVFDHTGQPVVAVGLVGVSTVVERELENYLPMLRETAETISAQLGWEAK